MFLAYVDHWTLMEPEEIVITSMYLFAVEVMMMSCDVEVKFSCGVQPFCIAYIRSTVPCVQSSTPFPMLFCVKLLLSSFIIRVCPPSAIQLLPLTCEHRNANDVPKPVYAHIDYRCTDLPSLGTRPQDLSRGSYRSWRVLGTPIEESTQGLWVEISSTMPAIQRGLPHQRNPYPQQQ